MEYAKHFSTRSTPQSEPIPGSSQVANSAGGYSFQVDEWTRLDRFLILGSEGGSYYASERTLTRENAEGVVVCLKADGPRTVARIVEISTAGRAPKNDPAIFALALALKLGDEQTRRLARAAVPQVCRIGTHLFQLAEAVKALGGWGRNTKGAFADWYEKQDLGKLALNLVKYQSRNGWSHRDMLRKVHLKPATPERSAAFHWAVGKPTRFVSPPRIIQGFEKAKTASPKELVGLIAEYGLPRECIPTEALNSPEVWEALLMAGEGMPFTALIRNLAKLTSVGLLKPLSKAASYITGRLADAEGLRRARVHPLQILIAQSIYASGHGLKGSLTWTPVGPVVDALDAAFYAAFANVEPTGKRYLLALDVSGSMGSGSVAGSMLTPRDASAAMALLTAKTEKQHHIFGFSSRFMPLDISASMRLDTAIEHITDLPFESTDCSLPMVYAQKHKLEVDVFVVYTDSETYAGRVHPVQALKSYRQATGIPAKLIVCGMVANEFTIADPSDAGMLDVVGFDANVPAVMADFVRA